MEKSDVYLGGFTVLFSALLWVFLIPKYVVVPGNIERFYMGPDFWIKIIAIALFLLGAALLVKARRVSSFQTSGTALLPRLVRLGAGLAIFLAFYVLLEPLGIIITSALAIFSCSWIYGERRFKYMIPLSIFLPMGLYLFFLKVASIPMPQGILAGIGPF